MSKRDEWIDGMMAEGRPQDTYQSIYERRGIPKASIGTYALYIVIALVMFGLAVLTWNHYPWVVALAVGIGLISLFLVYKGIQSQIRLDSLDEAEYQAHLAHHRTIQHTSLSQRPDLVASLTMVEIEQYRSQGALNAAQLEYLRDERHVHLTQAESARVRAFEAEQATLTRQHEATQTQGGYRFQQTEAAKDRSFKAAESERDRRQAIDILIARFEGDISKLRAQMELAQPDAYKQKEYEMATLESKMTQLKHINEIEKTDAKLGRQLFDQFKRQWKV